MGGGKSSAAEKARYFADKRFVPAEMNRFLTLFYGFIRFLQEILLDFTAAGEVYYNRFRMEQRAACRGAILHLFKFT